MRKNRLFKRLTALVLVGTITIGTLLGCGKETKPTLPEGVELLGNAIYPEMAKYPVEYSENFEAEWNAWRQSRERFMQEPGYADSLQPFFAKSMSRFLVADDIENHLFSPVNVYMALAMLAEITDGDSRQQILDALGNKDIEEVRKQANAVWNAQYRDDGVTSCILGNSLWLRDDMDYNKETLERLATNYFASSYRGEMGSDKFNQALHDWMNKQTNSLLKDQIDQINMSPETLLALVSTIYFRAKWNDEFYKEATSPDVFHGANGDITCDFMHEQSSGAYYKGERFVAVNKSFSNTDGGMLFLLPNEGEKINDLLQDEKTLAFLVNGNDYERYTYPHIRMSIPKFDVNSQTDMKDGLQALGITDVFDSSKADFAPIFTNHAVVSSIKHGVRVKIDEEGVEAAAYTVMMMDGTAMPEEIVDFTLDRPFIFVVYSGDGLPLFTGVVNQP